MKTLFLILFSFSAFAIPEAGYQRVLKAEVMPLYDSMEKGSFKNAQGMNIHYRFALKSGANKSLVILPGRTEPAVKYAEVIYDLSTPDLNVFIMDHQGQGESARLLNDTQKGYVVNFNDYVVDLEQWMKEVVLPKTDGTDKILLSHSMGGAIGTLYLTRNPSVFQKAVFSAPMYQIDTDPYPELVAKLITGTLMVVKKGANYAPGYGPYKPETDTIETTKFTHSSERFEMNKALFVGRPELTMSLGPTVRWVNETLMTLKKFERHGKVLELPMLILQAGSDKIVKPKKQTQLCLNARDCRLVVFPGSYHEILMETDDLRNEALSQIQNFFAI